MKENSEAAKETEVLAMTLVSSLGVVLQKFLECYSKAYDPGSVSEAMTQAIILLNQNHIEYLCDLCNDNASDIELAKEEMLAFIKWQHKMNVEIYEEKFTDL